MPTDLDQLITQSVHQRADSPVPLDPAGLMRTAIAKGRRIRTRRRVAKAVVAVVAVAGIAVAGTLVPRRDTVSPLPAPDPSDSSTPTGNLGVLPDAGDQPGAAARPDLVATDPRVMHFSVDTFAKNTWRATWYSGPDFESVEIGQTRWMTTVMVARSAAGLKKGRQLFAANRTIMSAPAAVTIGGRPGTSSRAVGLDYWSLTWQPVDGLWAAIDTQADSLDDAIAQAGKIRLDQAKRCVLPFWIGARTGATPLVSCSVAMVADRSGNAVFGDGELTFGTGGNRIRFYGSDSFGGGVYKRPLKAGPYNVWADPRGGNWTMLVDDIFLDISSGSKKAYSRQQMLDWFATMRMAPDQQDPKTW